MSGDPKLGDTINMKGLKMSEFFDTLGDDFELRSKIKRTVSSYEETVYAETVKHLIISLGMSNEDYDNLTEDEKNVVNDVFRNEFVSAADKHAPSVRGKNLFPTATSDLHVDMVRDEFGVNFRLSGYVTYSKSFPDRHAVELGD